MGELKIILLHMILDADEKVHITSGTTTQVYTGPCVLRRVIVNIASSNPINIIDQNDSGATPVIASMEPSMPPGAYEYNCVMANGIQIVYAGDADLTITYRV
jgi:hypothetical protein